MKNIVVIASHQITINILSTATVTVSTTTTTTTKSAQFANTTFIKYIIWVSQERIRIAAEFFFV